MYYGSLHRARDHQNCIEPTYEHPRNLVDVVSDDEDEVEELGDVHAFSALPSSLQDDDVEITGVVLRQPTRSSAGAQQIYQIRGATYNCARGKCVELKDGTFIRIKGLTEEGDGSKWVIGQLFLRHNDFNDARWPRRHNELVMSARVENGQFSDLVRRPVEQVKRNRHLILTNFSHPKMSSQTHPGRFADVYMDKELGPLFCRWKRTHYLIGNKTVIEESIERLSFEAADHETRTEDWLVQYRWRKVPTVPGGDHNLKRIMVTDDAEPEIQHHHSYTFGDAFCGGGGASCGASLAGLFVKFGVDLDEKAMRTYKLNFSSKGAECFHQDIHDFIRDLRPGQHVVDVLHDERNEAALFSVGELLTKLKPRVVTLEETYGLLNRHEEWFNGLIKMFLDCGYSIRWTGARLEQYGLPQRRQRLLIIAAGPGETLPAFPAYTHSATNPNLSPLTTIHDAIGSLPTNSPTITHHNIRAATYPHDKFRQPYSPHTQAKTITCTGGIGNHHPSGTRNFTVRELACLQRFPMDYKFADLGVTALRKQVGNAVPPFVFKKIFRSVIESLKRTDGVL